MEQKFKDFLKSEDGLKLLTELLRDNLSVQVSVGNTYEYGKGVRVTVRTEFCDVLVSENDDFCTF